MYLLRCLYHAVSFLRVYDLKWRHFKFIHVHTFHMKLSPCINSNSCHQWGNQRCGACRWGISGTKTCFKILQEQRSWECQLCFCRTWMTIKTSMKTRSQQPETLKERVFSTWKNLMKLLIHFKPPNLWAKFPRNFEEQQFLKPHAFHEK